MTKRIALISFIGILSLLFFLEGFAYYVSRERPSPSPSVEKPDFTRLLRRNKELKKRIERLSPRDVYIVIDTARNLLFLKKGDKILLEAVISSGSGNILRDPNDGRQWIFDTPRGEFEVRRKIEDPAWIKPDWAFIEEGERIPKDWRERIEEGVLGDYAMAFGNGYFIHGTLYTRLLGRNVTHGCIRVGDKDLETIYKLSRTGTKIFIF